MYIIRADGNAKIGAGHLMRCMTVADELALLEGNRECILFLCADEQSAALAAEHGFRAEVLGTDYRDLEAELPRWKECLRGLEENADGAQRKEPGRHGENVILADSYYVTDAYLDGLKKFGQVALLDDMGEHRFPADCVINYNAPADRAAYEKLYEDSGSRLVIGSEYVPVRPQFLNRRCQIRPEVKKVLITTGGGDVDNIARRIFDKIEDEAKEYYLIIGQFNPHFGEMKELEERCQNLHILHHVTDMAGLMEACDIAVTAGGTTIYELAAVGVPFICFSYAENQEALTEYIGNKDIAGFAGAYHREPEQTLDRLEQLFQELCRDREKRLRFCGSEQAMIDGHGAERLAGVLKELSGGIEGAEKSREKKSGL